MIFFSGKTAVFLCAAFSGCYSASVGWLREKEIECYSQEKVYHEESDQCYKLATKGPCEAGKWLVLEKNAKRINPICAKEKCEDGKYYMPNAQKCVEPKNKEIVCGEWQGTELINNVFGEGECVCTREPWRTKMRGDKNCYQLYTRGPCEAGHVVALQQNETAVAACVTDPCLDFKKTGSEAVLAPFGNGTCYELGTRGPCPEGLTFKVHVRSLKPSCVSLTTSIFSLQRPQNCYQDENGDCQKRVTNNRRRDAEKFQMELFNAIKQ